MPAHPFPPNYDVHGNRTELTHPDGKTFEYEFDAADRLLTLTQNGGAATLATFGYDAGLSPISMTPRTGA